MSEMKTGQDILFSSLPQFPPALPDDELKLLAILPDYNERQSVTAVDWEDEPACRRLEKRGLIKVHRWKDDDLAARPTLYAGRLHRLALSSAPVGGA